MVRPLFRGAKVPKTRSGRPKSEVPPRGQKQPKRYPKGVLTIQTTKRSTADQRRTNPFVVFREDRSMTEEGVWVFVDGSSSGWHAAVVLERGKTIAKYCEHAPKTDTRNVGAELNAMVMGLKYVPPHAKKVFVVHDYLGLGAWMTDNWDIKKDEVADKIAEAKATIAAAELDVTFIHHAGHQKDDSEFTRWNKVVDEMCEEKTWIAEETEWR